MNIKDITTKIQAPWVHDSIIFSAVHGSHAYGLNNELSDKDVRGICIPPKEYLYGIKTFEQFVLNEPDAVIYSLTKFVKLSTACNPNCVATFR